MRLIISARLNAVSLALLWLFMRRWCLVGCCFHKPTFPKSSPHEQPIGTSHLVRDLDEPVHQSLYR